MGQNIGLSLMGPRRRGIIMPAITGFGVKIPLMLMLIIPAKVRVIGHWSAPLGRLFRPTSLSGCGLAVRPIVLIGRQLAMRARAQLGRMCLRILRFTVQVVRILIVLLIRRLISNSQSLMV